MRNRLNGLLHRRNQHRLLLDVCFGHVTDGMRARRTLAIWLGPSRHAASMRDQFFNSSGNLIEHAVQWTCLAPFGFGEQAFLWTEEFTTTSRFATACRLATTYRFQTTGWLKTTRGFEPARWFASANGFVAGAHRLRAANGFGTTDGLNATHRLGATCRFSPNALSGRSPRTRDHNHASNDRWHGGRESRQIESQFAAHRGYHHRVMVSFVKTEYAKLLRYRIAYRRRRIAKTKTIGRKHKGNANCLGCRTPNNHRLSNPGRPTMMCRRVALP